MLPIKFSLTILAVVVVATAVLINAQQTIPLLPETCLLETNSPQFAILCRLENGTNAALPLFGGHTADQVCDGDCRCVMGATARGGRCGTRPDGERYCICDYRTTPKRPPLALTIALNCFGFDLALSICSPPNILNRLCDSDCICSHGYPNATGSAGECVAKPDVSGNDKHYCFCGNGANYFTVPT